MTLEERLRGALATEATSKISLLLGDSHAFDGEDASVDAAVLIAVTDRAEPGLILTQRPETMRKHPGQVAFPGGRVDATDADVIAAALREAEEEIALPRDAVRVIGLADRYRTGTGFDITPVIAIIAPDLPLHPNDDEVAAIFEVPLSFVLEPANHSEVRIEWQGRERVFYEMHWQGFRIWGATAAIIVNLSRRLGW